MQAVPQSAAGGRHVNRRGAIVAASELFNLRPRVIRWCANRLLAAKWPHDYRDAAAHLTILAVAWANHGRGCMQPRSGLDPIDAQTQHYTIMGG